MEKVPRKTVELPSDFNALAYHQPLSPHDNDNDLAA